MSLGRPDIECLLREVARIGVGTRETQREPEERLVVLAYNRFKLIARIHAPRFVPPEAGSHNGTNEQSRAAMGMCDLSFVNGYRLSLMPKILPTEGEGTGWRGRYDGA